MRRFPLVFMLGGPPPVLGSPPCPQCWMVREGMRRNVCLLLLVLALPASAADRSEEVRSTEIAFAKALADRDAKKFFLYLADDVQFLGRRNTQHGTQRVIPARSE